MEGLPPSTKIELEKKNKGPDNPTRQLRLLSIISTKCCSGDGEGKTKEVVEDREVKQSCV